MPGASVAVHWGSQTQFKLSIPTQLPWPQPQEHAWQCGPACCGMQAPQPLSWSGSSVSVGLGSRRASSHVHSALPLSSSKKQTES